MERGERGGKWRGDGESEGEKSGKKGRRGRL